MSSQDGNRPFTSVRPRVFVVDDDDGVRSAVSMLVRTFGWEAVPCTDAEDFLARYEPRAEQCLVLDLTMPGMGGLALQRELRRRGDDLPVIVITAQHDRPEAESASRQGARMVLKKPFNDDDLLNWIQCSLDP